MPILRKEVDEKGNILFLLEKTQEEQAREARRTRKQELLQKGRAVWSAVEQRELLEILAREGEG